MAYFLAPALVSLRNDVNARWPDRSKVSDGWIGDTSHSARPSDHNPDYSDGGIVRAIDVTNDGIDVDWFIAWAIGDARTAYVISRGRIWQNPAVYSRGGWMAYTGTNRHDHHVHVSVRHGSYSYDSRAWLPAIGQDSSLGWDDLATKDEVKAALREVLVENTFQNATSSSDFLFTALAGFYIDLLGRAGTADELRPRYRSVMDGGSTLGQQYDSIYTSAEAKAWRAKK